MLTYLQGSTHMNRALSAQQRAARYEAIGIMAAARAVAYFKQDFAQAEKLDIGIALLQLELRGGTKQALQRLVTESAHDANEPMVRAFRRLDPVGISRTSSFA